MDSGGVRRAYSYLRFSSPIQAKGDSFRRQIEAAASYAARNGLELDESLTFHDIGVSAYRGANSEMGQLNVLLEAVKTELIPNDSVILVESLDRISRQTARKALRIIESIVEAGVSVVTINDGREYTAESLDNDPLSLLMAILTFVRANEESTIKSQRVAASWAARRARALEQPFTSRCPGWLKLSEDKKSFVLLHDHVATVQRIFREALAGGTVLSIVRRLNMDGVPVPHGGGRRAAFWQPSTILYLINNRATTGTITTRRYVQVEGKTVRTDSLNIDGYYPSIISKEDFERLQLIRKGCANDENRRRGRLPIKNLLAGLTVCGNCGGPMMLTARAESSRYLVCRRIEYRAGCTHQSVRYPEIEQTIRHRLLEALPNELRGSSHVVRTHLTVLSALLEGDAIDPPEVNKLLKRLIDRITLYQSHGRVTIHWKQGHESTLESAFTPTTKRWTRYKNSKPVL